MLTVFKNSDHALSNGLGQLDDYPGINDYCLIIRVNGFRILYRPDDSTIVLVSLSETMSETLRVERFTIFSCDLSLERLQGTISGSLELLVESGPQKEPRAIVFRDAIARLYPIRAACVGSHCRAVPKKY